MNFIHSNIDHQKWMLILLVSALVFSLIFWFVMIKETTPSREMIKVGILHSLSGTMMSSERSVANATLLAVEQINASGGLLGRKIKPIIINGQSGWTVFSKQAEHLITQEKVSVLFGCWTSDCRKTVKSVVEKYNSLLFYPLQYEGVEVSDNIVYTGATPNQQITPSLYWLIHKFGKKIFLVGSDYIYPRMANAIINDYSKALGADIVGEYYLPLGSQNVTMLIDQLRATKPDVILNTLRGDTNIAFFKALHQTAMLTQGVQGEDRKIPVISYSLNEQDLANIGIENMQGHYAAWDYFQSINTATNHRFVSDFQQRFGQDQVVSSPMAAAYTAVYLWAQAVKDAGNLKINDVRSSLSTGSFLSPSGYVYIDSNNLHTWKTARVAQVQKNGQFKVVWQSKNVIEPILYLPFRSKKNWQKMEETLYNNWGGQWHNPQYKQHSERL